MSTTDSDFQFAITHESIDGDGTETKTFDDQNEFYTTRELIEKKGLDYKQVTPQWFEDDQEASTDGGDVDAEVVEHTNGHAESDNSAVEEEEPQDTNPDVVVEEPTEPDEEPLPDRTLHDDPISWLQAGSDEFTTTIKGTTVITKKGFRVLQHKYDISTGSELVVGPEETDHTFARAKAWAEMPDGRRAEAHASAHVDRGDDSFLLTSMADTRAKSRALSDVTGVGAVAIEEMQRVDDGN